MNIDKEKLREKLMKYFDIGTDGCMAYNLTRVKEARQYGTLTIDDFEEDKLEMKLIGNGMLIK